MTGYVRFNTYMLKRKETKNYVRPFEKKKIDKQTEKSAVSLHNSTDPSS